MTTVMLRDKIKVAGVGVRVCTVFRTVSGSIAWLD